MRYAAVADSTAAYARVHALPLTAGRMFTTAEDRRRRRVAVVGASIPHELCVGPLQLLGSTLLIRGIMVEIERVLRPAHSLRPGQPDDFHIHDRAAVLTTFQSTTRTFSLLLAGVAAVSLLVGGIGIMNIMLVSVTERTREIGTRRAVGARRADILFQFLVEALVLSTVGGLIGVLSGMAGASLLSTLAHWNTHMVPLAIPLALGVSLAVGLTFGVWPARSAARLDPVDALRRE